MKNLIDTIKNIWRIEELRNRILITLGLLLVYRIGSFIVLPGVDSNMMAASSSGDKLVSQAATHCSNWARLVTPISVLATRQLR